MSEEKKVVEVETAKGTILRLKGVSPSATVGRLRGKIAAYLQKAEPEEGWEDAFILESKAARGVPLIDSSIIPDTGLVALKPSPPPPPRAPLKGTVKSPAKGNASPAAPPPVLLLHFPGASPSHMKLKNINPSVATFGKIRRVVAKQTGSDPALLTFVYEGRKVGGDDAMSLAAAGVPPNTTLTVIKEAPATAAAAAAGPPHIPPASRVDQPNAVVEVSVENAQGERIRNLRMSVDAKVVPSLAALVDDTWGVPARLVQIAYLGRVLAKDETFHTAGIPNGAVLQAVARPSASGSLTCSACLNPVTSSPYCPANGTPHVPVPTEPIPTTTVSVKSVIDGKEYKMPNLRVTATVRKVKSLMSKAAGIPVYDQFIINSRGDVVDDTATLIEAGMANGQPAMLKLRPGAGSVQERPALSPPCSLAPPPPQQHMTPASLLQPQHTPNPTPSTPATAPPPPPTSVVLTQPAAWTPVVTPSPDISMAHPYSSVSEVKALYTLEAMRRHKARVGSPDARTPHYPPSRSPITTRDVLPVPSEPVWDRGRDQGEDFAAVRGVEREAREEAVEKRSARSPTPSALGELDELYTEDRMRIARMAVHDATVDHLLDAPFPTSSPPGSLFADNTAEARTLRRMEAARRADLLARREKGAALNYRPLKPGTGLEEDPSSLLRLNRLRCPSPSSASGSVMRCEDGPSFVHPVRVSSPYLPPSESLVERAYDPIHRLR